MATATNYTIRLDADLRRESEALFSELGLNLSTAINIFLHKALKDGGRPFEVRRRRPNATTRAALREADRLLNDPNTKWYDSSEEMFAELDK